MYQLFSGNAASSKTEACGIAVTAMALTEAYKSAGGTGKVYDVSGLSAFKNYISSQPVPKGFNIYRISDGNSNTQDLFTWEYSPEGYLKVKRQLQRAHHIASPGRHTEYIAIQDART